MRTLLATPGVEIDNRPGAGSIIGNDLRSIGGAKGVENRIGTTLAEFSR